MTTDEYFKSSIIKRHHILSSEVGELTIKLAMRLVRVPLTFNSLLFSLVWFSQFREARTEWQGRLQVKAGLVCVERLAPARLVLDVEEGPHSFDLDVRAVCSALLLYLFILSLIVLHSVCVPHRLKPKEKENHIHTAESGTQIPEGHLPSVRPVFISFQQGQRAALCPLGKATQMQV